MAERPTNDKFSNLPKTHWLQSEYDEMVNKNSKLICKTCDIEVNSHEQLRQHINGQAHMSKCKSQEMLFDRQYSCDTPESNLSVTSNRLTEEFISCESPNDNICTICNIPFTSPSHRDSHYKGKKHALKLKKLEEEDLPLQCPTCNVSFSSKISAKDHFNSEKHKKKANLGNTLHPTTGGTDNTKWVFCGVCKKFVNSFEQFRIHCNSEKHKKKESIDVTSSRRNSIQMSHENETNEGAPYKPTGDSTFTTPKVDKGQILPKTLLPNITAVEAIEKSIQNSRNYSNSSKLSNNLETSYDDSSEDSSLKKDTMIGDLTKSPIVSSDAELKETLKRYTNNANSHSVSELFDLSSDLTTDSSMKKVPNSMQLNNNSLDNVACPHNNLIKTNNNLSLPEKTNSSFSDFENPNPMINESISDDQISNLITALKNMSVSNEIKNLTPPRRDDCNNQKVPESHKAAIVGSGGTQRSKTARSSPLENKEDEIPDIHKMWIKIVEINGKIICYYCDLCESKLNQGAVKIHIEGSNHRQKLMTRPVPERDLPPVERNSEDILDEAYHLTHFMPRSYQVELFEKCHLNDSIIFLPTGTGKTLCASMLISYMLKKNPKRSVLFLVDKVLLVFQQKNFIEGQLKKKFLRFDFQDNDKLVERDLNIACICRGTTGTEDKPLWMHDIIISTAAFCSNMIAQKVIRWSDFSFVVVDEAHHCVKNHPFKRIFSTQHGPLKKDQRPQILGLTASPAGEETLEGTIKMLINLSINMGDAKISIVEGAVDELIKYKSNAKLVIEMLSPTNEEMSFNNSLQKYLMQCLIHLEKKSNISNFIDFISNSDDIVLNTERLDELQNAFSVLTIDKDKAAGTSLLWHVQKITSALSVSLEMGIPLALEELKSLSDKDNNTDGFSKALEIGLPCQQIKETCEKYAQVMEDALWEQDAIMSTVHYLAHKIASHINLEGKKNAIVLVLVKQRATALQLCKIIKKLHSIKQLNLSCISLVGHGAGTGVGMNVNDQKKTLKEIKDNLHQVIIATSVAEEGIDLPECSLVITMKPPTSITTLVQMRGRARKKNSLFLTVCSTEKEKSKIDNLLKQEEIMEKATHKLVEFYKKK